MGLGGLQLKNWALLAKWWWRFGEEKGALWKKVIESKYGGFEKSVPRYRLPRLWAVISSFGDVSNNSGGSLSKRLEFQSGGREVELGFGLTIG